MKTLSAMVDSGKRRTLKRLIGTAGATATLVSLPSFAKQASIKKVVIDVTLVSIPGTTNETLLLKNLTNKPLTVDQIQHAIITFDGETMDCGAVCHDTSITIPAKMDVMLHFNSLPAQGRHIASANSLNVQADVSRLPEGTRVIPLKATMQGSTATLLQA